MSHGLKDSRALFVGDFETTTDPNDCRVWLWAMADITTDEVEFGNNIKSFCRFLAKQESYTWFHNLAFDGSFIIDHLMRSGYTWVKEKPRPQEFTTLISMMGKFYSITINWSNGNITELRDSLKKMNMPVRDIAGAYHLDVTKGEIDYKKERPKGYEPTPEEYEYVTNDVLIVARALRVQINTGLTGLTVGADALSEYKTIVTKKRFNTMFPILPIDIDKEIRKAYRGGFTYANPAFSQQRLRKGRVYDVNSLYPTVMYNDLLPMGDPIWNDGIPRPTALMPLWIASMTITAKLKPNKIPCIQIKGVNMFSSTEYQTEIKEPVTIACTNVDWALWNDHYDIQVLEYNGYFKFQASRGLFNEYIDKWSAIKANSKGGMRAIAKLQLNSLYGKFATNPNVTPKIPVFDEKTDRIRLVMGEHEERNPVYTPMGVFITSYARNFTVRSAQDHYERFIYADTDSVHLLGWEDTQLDIHPTEMGKWKHEYDFIEAYYLRAKAYSDRLKDGSIETHIAGLPKHIAETVTFEHYEVGHKFDGKLVPKRVPGGIILEDTQFELRKK